MSSQPMSAKPSPRVLACVLCQQRKIKCDRTFPCANCKRANAQCVPLSAPRQRRRRFPERELLDRLRHYESVLKQNEIPFEPLHPDTPMDESPVGGLQEESSPSSKSNTQRMTFQAAEKTQTMNLFHAMSQTITADDRHSDEDQSGFLSDTNQMREAVIKKAWDQAYEGERHNPLLFGPSNIQIDLSDLHPDTGKIFKLWHVYLENVNPLLKITHTPTLQARFIDAASDIATTSPVMEALMFAIYCISVQSLDDEDCTSLLGVPKKGLLATFSFGCQQALTNARVLCSSDRDCLIALFLYLVSVRPDTDPRALSSTLGVAVRIGQRMGIHDESSNAKCTAIEAELRRRLWWSLVMFDRRICEMSDFRTTTLAPTWDCNIPLNVSDFEIRTQMKTLPVARDGATDAVFAVVRSELGDFLRHSTVHLAFTNPCLADSMRGVRKSGTSSNDLDTFAKRIEEQYVASCNAENPLDFMTIWTARGQIAKYRLLDYYYNYAKSSSQQTDTQRDTAVAYTLDMLKCDTKLMTSPLIKSYKWFNDFQFPFPAYIHILQDLRKRPTMSHAKKAWETMGDNHAARMKDLKKADQPFFILFSRLVLQAWGAQEAWIRKQNHQPADPPPIVIAVRNEIVRMTSEFRVPDGFAQHQPPSRSSAADLAEVNALRDLSIPMSMLQQGEMSSLATENLFSTIGQQSQTNTDMDSGMDDFDWAAFDWAAMHVPGWS